MYLRLFLFVIVIIRIQNTVCKNLTKCAENSICDCEYQQEKCWTIVYCNGRGISKLPRGIPANVTRLYLDNNTISKIDDDALLQFPLLKKVNLNFNNLTYLPKFPKLIETIYARNNKLGVTGISGAFANLTRLSAVYLGHNQLKRLTSTMFKDTSISNIIELRYNPLKIIEPYTFNSLNRVFKIKIGGTDDLNVHGLSEDTFLFSSEIKAITMTVDGTRALTKISPGTFRDLPNYSTIRLIGCNITAIPERVIHGKTLLLKLDLRNNMIKYIHPDAFVDLESIVKIYLMDNLLTVFPRALQHLRIFLILELSWNNISSLGDEPVLKQGPYFLILTRNKIQNISRDNFSGLQHLGHVMLLQNRIKRIDDGAFKGTNIEYILLQGNLLKTITTEMFYVQSCKLKNLYIYDNPLEMVEPNAFSHMAPDSTVYLKCDDLTRIPSTPENISVFCVKRETEIVLNSVSPYGTSKRIGLFGMICNGTRCTPCRQGHFGKFAETSFCRSCPPGGYYQDEVGFVEKGNYIENCKICPNGSFSSSAGAGSVADCKTCPAGTKTDRRANLNACDCLDNFHRTDRFGSCQPCPVGVNCTGGIQRLYHGYWWCWKFPTNLGRLEDYQLFVDKMKSIDFDEGNPDVLKETMYNGTLPAVHICPRKKSCIGDATIKGSCDEGYSGWLCAVCDEHYYELFNECFKCQRISIIVTIFIVISILFVFIGYVVWKLDRKGRRRNERNRMSSFITHLKIAINFYQILGILSEVNEISWPEDFESVGQSLQYLDIIRYINILSPRCMFSNWNAYNLLYTAVATPFVIAVTTSAVGFIYAMWNRCREYQPNDHLKGNCLTIIIMLLYLTYANTCYNIMAVGPWSIRVFNVTADGNYRKKLLTSDYSIDIDGDGDLKYNVHKKIVYFSLFYVISFPLAVAAVLYYRYKRNGINYDEQSATLGLKFFCRQYNDKFWYWEVFEMYNKAVLALIANFKDDEASNMSYSLFVTVVLVALHLYLEPMKEKSDQRFQLLTLIFVIVNLSIGAIVSLDQPMYAPDETIAVLHNITPIVLLLLNMSILLIVLVDLIKKIKEDIWDSWSGNFEYRNAQPITNSDYGENDDDAPLIRYQDASSTEGPLSRQSMVI